MVRTIPDYFEMEHKEDSVEQEQEDCWLDNSGDRGFFEEFSDEILATWEQRTGQQLVSLKVKEQKNGDSPGSRRRRSSTSSPQ